jgi:hypothetical protein
VGYTKTMRVYRLEFLQPDGRWTGPYTAEYMSAKAFILRDKMMIDHKVHRPYPPADIFAKSPGRNRYVCASLSMESLTSWFGKYLKLLEDQGGHVGIYRVPLSAIAQRDDWQVVYQQRQAICLSRSGAPLDPELLVERFHPDKVIVRPKP